MSVYADTFNYAESCGKSHEFLRRGCTKTPAEINGFHWAGDLLVVRSVKVKQSEQNDMRGGASEIGAEFPAVSDSCGSVHVPPASPTPTEETAIRTQATGETTETGSFKWAVPKYDSDGNQLWDFDIFASDDVFCGVLTDGGDCYSNESAFGAVDSICGTIHRDLFNPAAYFLDNRITTEDDEDKGLLFIIRNGLNATHEVRWVDEHVLLQTGLDDAADITNEFKAALAAAGILESDVLSFGMI